MSSALTWGTRTQVASGSIGSYEHTGDDYTFCIYATATRNGRNASLFLEYTVTSNNSAGAYSQYSGPYFNFYVDNNIEETQHVSEIVALTTRTLATHTKTLTADSLGHFDTTSVIGEWIRGGTTGWAPKSITIQDTAVTLADIEALGINAKYNGSWEKGLVYAKVNGSWELGLMYANDNGTWKVGQ